MDEIVSEHILWELSLKVGHSWRDLGRCLLLDERDLYNIQMDYLPLQEGIFEMLLRWKSRNDHTATYTRLSFALMQAGRSHLGREVSTYPQSGRTLGFGKFKFEVGEMLSSHEVKRLSLYFNMPPGVMDRINRSKYPGLYFLSKLEDHGLINHTSVSRLVDALKQFGSHHTATLVEHSYQDNLPPHMGSSSHGLKDSLRSDEEISTKISAKVTDEQTEKDVSLAGSSSESTSSWKLPMLHRPVDDETLRELCGKIYREWKHVGRHLGLGELQLDFIEVDHRNYIREAIYTMLKMWKQRNGRDATFRVLGIALVKAGRKDLGDLVYERAYSKNKPSVTDIAMDNVVGIDTLMELSNEIGHAWRNLGRRFGMTEAELSNIEADNYLDRREMIQEMLLLWKRRIGTAATYGRLSEALRMIGRKDLSDKYMMEAAHSKNKPSVTVIARDNVVGIDTLMELSNEIGHAWRNLGRCFGMTEAELSNIEADNYLDRREMIQEMLLLWKRRNGPSATYGRLSYALRMIGRKDLSERYMMEAAYSKNKPSVTEIAMDKVVGIDTLLELSSEIGYEWRHLGRCLGMTYHELSYIERNDYMYRRELTHEMLFAWKRRNGQSATYGRLSEALRMIGREDLSERYMMETGAASLDSEREAELSTEITKEKTEDDIFQKYNELKGNIATMLSQSECKHIGNHFKLAKDHVDTIQTSDSSAEVLVDILEERGYLCPADVSKLQEALRVLKINDKALHMLNGYAMLKAKETPFERFLAALSSHLMQSVLEKLCEYFQFTDDEKEGVITDKSPGFTFLVKLYKKGKIGPSDVDALVDPLRQHHLMQAVAKVEEYQMLVEERNELKTPVQTFEEIIQQTDKRSRTRNLDKRNLLITFLKGKIKSWYESMTPIPWKKSCKWMTSDLFINCGLSYTNYCENIMPSDSLSATTVQYMDIFTHEKLRRESRIIIEGDPGSGKTMLAFQLAYNWSIGKLTGVDLVVILPLRLVQDMTITEAIEKFYLPEDAPLDKDDIQDILGSANEESKTCILLDGVEEYNGKTEDGEASEVNSVMVKDKLATCTVILTTRTGFVTDLPLVPVLKLLQFGEEGRDQYIAKVFPGDEVKQQQVKLVIQNSDFLQDLCSNALLFIFVIHNIEHLTESQSKDLERVGAFMEMMIDTLMPGSKSATLEEGKQSNRQFAKLSEIAFNGLCKQQQQQLMWQKTFLEDKISNLQEWIESGILVVEENVAMRESQPSIDEVNQTEEEQDKQVMTDPHQSEPTESQGREEALTSEKEGGPIVQSVSGNKIKSSSGVSDVTKVAVQVKFLHKVIQEYFAAKHFSLVFKQAMQKNQHREFLKEHLRKINPADLHYVLRFTSYLCPDSCHLIMENLLEIFKPKEGSVPILNCISLCFAEFDSSIRDDHIDNALRLVLKHDVTIGYEDSIPIQRSKVSMITYAARHKIGVECLTLESLVARAEEDHLIFNSGVTVGSLPNVRKMQIRDPNQKVIEETVMNIMKFIANCSMVKEARLEFASEPPNIEESSVTSKMKSRNVKLQWNVEDHIKSFDFNTGKWNISLDSSDQQQSSSVETAEKSEELTDQLPFPPLRVERVVTKEGGTLVIPGTGVCLEIPQRALENESKIEMGIISYRFQDESELVFSKNSTTVVELHPSNLKLLKPVKLTLPHCLVLEEKSPRKAKIYSSRHIQGAQPSWEQVHNARYKLKDHDCDIWLQNFCWKTFRVDDKKVRGKRIILYAAKSLPFKCSNALIEVGYYYDLPKQKVPILNKSAVLKWKKIIFYKKPKNGLKLVLQEVDPNIFTCTKTEGFIPFNVVAELDNYFCTFNLKKQDSDAVTETCICTFRAEQEPHTHDLMFDVLPEQPSTSSSRRVLKEDVEELSKLIGNDWKNVGRRLDFTEADLENLEKDNTGQREVALQMFLQWMERKGSAATYNVLGDALIKAGRADLGETFKKGNENA